MNQKENKLATLAVWGLLLLCTMCLLLYYSNTNLHLRRALAAGGHDVDGITFEFVEKHTAHELLYRSSQPIECNGNPVSFWLVCGCNWPMPSTGYIVTPYTPILTEIKQAILLFYSD